MTRGRRELGRVTMECCAGVLCARLFYHHARVVLVIVALLGQRLGKTEDVSGAQRIEHFQSPVERASSTSPPCTYSLTMSALSDSANHSCKGAAEAEGSVSALILAFCILTTLRRAHLVKQAVRVLQLAEDVHLVILTAYSLPLSMCVASRTVAKPAQGQAEREVREWERVERQRESQGKSHLQSPAWGPPCRPLRSAFAAARCCVGAARPASARKAREDRERQGMVSKRTALWAQPARTTPRPFLPPCWTSIPWCTRCGPKARIVVWSFVRTK